MKCGNKNCVNDAVYVVSALDIHKRLAMCDKCVIFDSCPFVIYTIEEYKVTGDEQWLEVELV